MEGLHLHPNLEHVVGQGIFIVLLDTQGVYRVDLDITKV
jgi:hypothetical protein